MTGLPAFARDAGPAAARLTRIGEGSIGGKAEGLALAERTLARRAAEIARSGLAVEVPRLVVLATGFYDAFVERNGLDRLAESGAGDRELADAFHRAPVPAELVGDLRALAELFRVPLAVRSSSELEDALGRPFAGVYGTKMLPGNAPDAAGRFRSLLDAVKFVWASACSERARAYRAAVGASDGGGGRRESMAVVVQEVHGTARGERFYPEVSGVARSIDFYPAPGARPEEGVLVLALGLGKTIVDGGLCWSVSLARPAGAPPFASARERLERTQRRFWAVRTGAPPAYDPMAETEFLAEAGLAEAEADGALALVASTWDAESDRIVPGTGRRGPRVADFAPLLVARELPLVETVRALVAACEEESGGPVELELALAAGPARPPRLALLQVRPLLVPATRVSVEEADLADPRTLLASRRAAGNGRRELGDVVYLDPERWDAAATPAIAAELERLDRALAAEGRDYLLLGFGRWGSSDPWLGVPVRWEQIAGARAIVEAGLGAFRPEPSQGSHFFHNLASSGVLYLSVGAEELPAALWSFLAAQPLVAASAHVRHVRPATPVVVEVDGRSGRGVVRRRSEGEAA